MTAVTPDPKLRNLLVAVTAVILSVAIFLGFQASSGPASLEAQAALATPLEIALGNGKPTLTEFYANWCTSCRAMAPELVKLKHEFGGSVNFVMLNVDNNKWLPEILRYRVDGIPHFVFLDRDGKTVAQAIGEQPRAILAADLAALLAGDPLPHVAASGQTSEFDSPVSSRGGPADPRAHGSRVRSVEREG